MKEFVKIFKYFGPSIFITFSLLYPLNFSYSISMSDSIYSGKSIRTDSSLIGGWMHYAYKCNFGYDFNILDRVAKLSWNDYKSFLLGWNQWNGKEPYCLKSKKKKIENWRKKYISSLENYLMANNLFPKNDEEKTNNEIGVLQNSLDKINQANKIAEEAKKESELLKQMLTDIKNQNKKKKHYIALDNENPLINYDLFYKNENTAIIKGNVSDNIGIAELIINNIPENFDLDGNFEISRYIPRNGKTIDIVAFDIKGNKSTKTFNLIRKNIQNTITPSFDELNPLGQKALFNPNALALIIGVSNYQNTPDAIYADTDAQVFYDYAVTKLGLSKDNIKELLNEQAEETEILLAVKDWLVRSVNPEKSDIYIFFAGHGLISKDGENMYLLPYDVSPKLLEKTALLKEELFTDLASSNPRSVTIFLDTCYSGETRSKEFLVTKRSIDIFAKNKRIPKNFTVFSAAGIDQAAIPLEETQHGLFSYFLMKGMEGEADKNKDSKITANELHNYIKKNVLKQSLGSQEPEFQGDKNRIIVSFTN